MPNMCRSAIGRLPGNSLSGMEHDPYADDSSSSSEASSGKRKGGGILSAFSRSRSNSPPSSSGKAQLRRRDLYVRRCARVMIGFVLLASVSVGVIYLTGARGDVEMMVDGLLDGSLLKWLHGEEETTVQAARHYRRLPHKKLVDEILAKPLSERTQDEMDILAEIDPRDIRQVEEGGGEGGLRMDNFNVFRRLQGRVMKKASQAKERALAYEERMNARRTKRQKDRAARREFRASLPRRKMMVEDGQGGYYYTQEEEYAMMNQDHHPMMMIQEGGQGYAMNQDHPSPMMIQEGGGQGGYFPQDEGRREFPPGYVPPDHFYYQQEQQQQYPPSDERAGWMGHPPPEYRQEYYSAPYQEYNNGEQQQQPFFVEDGRRMLVQQQQQQEGGGQVVYEGYQGEQYLRGATMARDDGGYL